MKKKLFLLMVPILGFYFHSIAQGDLLISPKRVVFEGNKQKEILNLANIGKDTAVYSVSFVQYKMKEDGSFVTVKEEKPDSGQMFADPYLRIFPRTVTLAPQESQNVALQYKRNPQMKAGEYRSHLYFRAEKNIKPLMKANDTAKALSVQLIPIYGLSIPIIIRTGAVNVSSTLSDLKLETRKDTIQYLNLTINRTGNISTYGDITINFIPVQGKLYEIGTIQGVAVYTSINKRSISIQLNKIPGVKLANGKLKVQYINNDDPKKPVVYADGELDIK